MENVIVSEFHEFAFRGEKIIFSPQTLSVLTASPVDQIIFSYAQSSIPVKELLNKCSDNGSFTESTITSRFEQLIDGGFLIQSTSAKPAAPQGLPVNCLTCMVNVSQTCNLKCKYCYVDYGNFAFKEYDCPPIMNEKTAALIPHFLVNEFPDVETYALHFYGGEPLLNFAVISQMVVSLKVLAGQLQKNVEFHITTNGTLITEEIAEFFDSNRFNVFLSIDGLKRVHDNVRKDISGKGTFQIVKDKLFLLKEKKNIHLIGSAVVQNGLGLKQATMALKRLGVDECKIEPVRLMNGNKLCLSADEHKHYVEEIGLIGFAYLQALKKHQKPFDPRLSSRILQLLVKKKRYFFCLAGSKLIGISTDGRIYPCALHCGQDKSELGSLSKGIDHSKIDKYLSAFGIEGQKKCRSCWNRYLCGGGCSAMVVKFGEDDCEVIKKESEVAIGVYNHCIETDPVLLYGLVSPEIVSWVYS